MALIPITAQADRDFLEDHEPVAIRLHELSVEHKALQDRADLFQGLADEAASKRSALGDKARRGLVRYKPALGSLLEAQLTDMALGRVDGVVTSLLTNAHV